MTLTATVPFDADTLTANQKATDEAFTKLSSTLPYRNTASLYRLASNWTGLKGELADRMLTAILAELNLRNA